MPYRQYASHVIAVYSFYDNNLKFLNHYQSRSTLLFLIYSKNLWFFSIQFQSLSTLINSLSTLRIPVFSYLFDPLTDLGGIWIHSSCFEVSEQSSIVSEVFSSMYNGVKVQILVRPELDSRILTPTYKKQPNAAVNLHIWHNCLSNTHP